MCYWWPYTLSFKNLPSEGSKIVFKKRWILGNNSQFGNWIKSPWVESNACQVNIPQTIKTPWLMPTDWWLCAKFKLSYLCNFKLNFLEQRTRYCSHSFRFLGERSGPWFFCWVFCCCSTSSSRFHVFCCCFFGIKSGYYYNALVTSAY